MGLTFLNNVALNMSPNSIQDHEILKESVTGIKVNRYK